MPNCGRAHHSSNRCRVSEGEAHTVNRKKSGPITPPFGQVGVAAVCDEHLLHGPFESKARGKRERRAPVEFHRMGAEEDAFCLREHHRVAPLLIETALLQDRCTVLGWCEPMRAACFGMRNNHNQGVHAGRR